MIWPGAFIANARLEVSLKLTVIIIIIIKKNWQWKAGRGRLTPYQSEDPSPTLPTYRGKEEKGKIVENKKGESNQANKKAKSVLSHFFERGHQCPIRCTGLKLRA